MIFYITHIFVLILEYLIELITEVSITFLCYISWYAMFDNLLKINKEERKKKVWSLSEVWKKICILIYVFIIFNYFCFLSIYRYVRILQVFIHENNQYFSYLIWLRCNYTEMPQILTINICIYNSQDKIRNVWSIFRYTWIKRNKNLQYNTE